MDTSNDHSNNNNGVVILIVVIRVIAIVIILVMLAVNYRFQIVRSTVEASVSASLHRHLAALAKSALHSGDAHCLVGCISA